MARLGHGATVENVKVVRDDLGGRKSLLKIASILTLREFDATIKSQETKKHSCGWRKEEVWSCH
ncbi:hypothetical protein GCM10027018_05020 [Paenibacillus thermoaerophilus]